ncbi:MAG: cupin-like domain-containing protein [Gammaproteobacteria bacterium]
MAQKATPEYQQAQPSGIARVAHPMPLQEFYLHHFLARQPVVLRTSGLAELGWRTHLWTNDYLRYKAGAQSVQVQRRDPGKIFEPDNSHYIPMVFREFLAAVMEKPDGDSSLYLNLQHLQENRALEPPALQLIGDFTLPYYFKDILLRCINVWMGNSAEPIVTPLHHDFNDNLYVVAEGRKHFTLFPPSQATNLYVRGKLLNVADNGILSYADMNNMPHVSRLDTSNVDIEQFPKYAAAEAARMDFVLEQNEMLFLPAGWFHQVSSTGRHIAVSFFAHTPSMEQMNWMRNLIFDSQHRPKDPQ